MRGLGCLLRRSKTLLGGFQTQKLSLYHDLAKAGRVGSRLEATGSDFEVKFSFKANYYDLAKYQCMIYTSSFPILLDYFLFAHLSAGPDSSVFTVTKLFILRQQ